MALPSSRISPTAYYTGAVWSRHGLSDRAFRNWRGVAAYAALWPVNRVSTALGGSSLEKMLIARHRVIDDQLERAIASGAISQVMEVAAGLSPRGLRFVRKHPSLTYVEADLKDMAARKRKVLAAVGESSPRHVVVDVDAFATSGPESVADICSRMFDPDRGTAIITEGLISYFDASLVASLWKTFADALKPFSAGLYLSDTHFESDLRQIPGANLFRRTLNRFTRGRDHDFFADEATALAALTDAGFSSAEVPYASDFADLGLSTKEQNSRVRVVIACL